MALVRRLALVSFLLLAPVSLQASPVCPWLTKGSAARLLGGVVSLQTSLTDQPGGSCIFSRAQGVLTYTLRIEIRKEPIAVACAAESTRVIGIGNEAVRCRTARSPSETVEIMASRLRDLFFTVELVTHGPQKLAMSLEAQRDAVNQAAEQVAGNLY